MKFVSWQFHVAALIAFLLFFLAVIVGPHSDLERKAIIFAVAFGSVAFFLALAEIIDRLPV